MDVVHHRHLRHLPLNLFNVHKKKYSNLSNQLSTPRKVIGAVCSQSSRPVEIVIA